MYVYSCRVVYVGKLAVIMCCGIDVCMYFK